MALMCLLRPAMAVLLRRRSMLHGFVGGAALTMTASTRSYAQCSAHGEAPRDASLDGLGSLWTAAIDGMIHVPGARKISSAEGVLYMAPSGPGMDARPQSWPAVFEECSVFSLTAWNPMGQDSPMAQNQRANAELQMDLKSLQPAPREVWHSFGFNAEEDWRENGFSVAFPHAQAELGRLAVLSLARKYEQAAIYEYRCADGLLLRRVVWCDDAKQQAEKPAEEAMVVLPHAPQTPLSKREWDAPS